jgi:hypothetical protein
MKKLIIFSVTAAVLAILSTGCSCWSKCDKTDRCAMCDKKIHPDKCIETCCGNVGYPCASHCMMCKKCKKVITPDKVKECKGKCSCGEKLQPMKNMSYPEMCKLTKEQAECKKGSTSCGKSK